MTLKELCTELNYSENTFKRSFNRTCEVLKRKKGIIINKTGIEPNADYTISYDETVIEPKVSKQKIHTELIGQRFGHLTVLQDSGERFHRGVVWTCQCDCGNIKNIPNLYLKNGHVKTCGNNCIYHSTYEDLTNQRFGKLIALYPTSMKDGSHMYWMCKCDCSNLVEVASGHLKKGDIQSCGCIKTSIGESNIKDILIKNKIKFNTQISFNDLKNIKSLRYDFGIYNDGNEIIRLIEFDGIQHFEEQNYFSHSLKETQQNDKIKNDYAKEHNIPLVRIPYTERDNITLDLILGDKYLI